MTDQLSAQLFSAYLCSGQALEEDTYDASQRVCRALTVCRE